MTPTQRLAAIRERLSKATPGEWRLMEGIKTIWIDAPKAGHSICDMDVIRPASDRPVARLDGDLIAHAGGTNGDLAWLLGIAEAAEKMATALQAMIALDECEAHFEEAYERVLPWATDAATAYDAACQSEGGKDERDQRR